MMHPELRQGRTLDVLKSPNSDLFDRISKDFLVAGTLGDQGSQRAWYCN